MADSRKGDGWEVPDRNEDATWGGGWQGQSSPNGGSSYDEWGYGAAPTMPAGGRGQRGTGLVWALGVLVLVLLMSVAGLVGYMMSREDSADQVSASGVTTWQTAPVPDAGEESAASAVTESTGIGAQDLESAGTRCEDAVTTSVGTRQWVRIDSGRISCADAIRVVQKYYDLPTDPTGGNTAPKEFDGWFCFAPTSGSAQQSGIGTSCTKGDVTLVVPVDRGRMDSPAPNTAGGGDGDLGLGVPMSRPACDGRGIVVLYSAVTPGAYTQEISTALARNPGASYLRTDMACPSLRARDENGNVIYAVYRPSGYTRQELCSDVRAVGPPAYGRWLDTTSDPSELVTC